MGPIGKVARLDLATYRATGLKTMAWHGVRTAEENYSCRTCELVNEGCGGDWSQIKIWCAWEGERVESKSQIHAHAAENKS